MNRHEIDVIESSVAIQNVLALHGVDWHGTRCRCPIHNGKRDSFSFTDKVFHCFTCGESGGVIQLEAKLDGTSEDEAVKTLARAFALDITDKPWTEEDVKNWKLNRDLEEDYKDYNKQKGSYYRRLSTLYRNIKDCSELAGTAQSLEQWLDENVNGVVQEWKYQSTP